MAQRPTGDWDIDPNTTSGSDLANILNRFQDAIDSGNSGASRPSYLAAGGLWVQEGNPMKLMFWTGSEDIEVFNTDDGSGIGAGMVISATEPENPKEGMQWLNSVTAEVFIYDGAVWLEFPGGKDGAPGQDGADGNIADGATDGTQDGIVATWDSTANSGAGQWTPDPTVIVNGGNVGIGTTANGNYQLSVAGDSRFGVGNATGAIRSLTSAESPTGVQAVEFGVLSGGAELHLGKSPQISTNGSQHKNIYNAHNHEFETNGITRLTIDPAGNATFSEQASAKTLTTSRGTNGFFLKAEYGTTGVSTTFGHNGGGNNFSISPAGGLMTVNGDFSADNVRTANGPVIDAKGLIKTLSTLRQATMDETQDIRESLRSAIDELVEGFEQEIATMPAEEQASTQEIEQ